MNPLTQARALVSAGDVEAVARLVEAAIILRDAADAAAFTANTGVMDEAIDGMNEVLLLLATLPAAKEG